MSEIKRYSLTLHKVKGKFESPEFERDNGEWVKFDDYARLQAEVERLRKAGDEVIHEWSSGHGTDVENFTKALWVWAVAKEGEPNA